MAYEGTNYLLRILKNPSVIHCHKLLLMAHLRADDMSTNIYFRKPHQKDVMRRHINLNSMCTHIIAHASKPISLSRPSKR